MGLDQYAYVATRSLAETRADTEERDLAYWRKHPRLQGWMEQRWISKGMPEIDKAVFARHDVVFNGIEVELTWEDLDELEYAVNHNTLPKTTGFFFGSNSSDIYREKDLEFIQAARAELFMGLRVFYNSSW